MERWRAVVKQAAQTLAGYERQTGKRTFDGGGSAAAVLEDVAWECFELEVIDDPNLGESVLGELDLDAGTISVRHGLEPGRKAFTIAHEIGHAALDHTPRILGRERRVQDLVGHVDERTCAHELEVRDGVYQAYSARD